GQEQVDLTHRHLGVGRRQLGPYVGVSAGRLQVGEERLAAGLEEAVAGKADERKPRTPANPEAVAML
ncbi:hypothetical protein, partial [Pseudomonas chlororaphis]|uniref:hypothetical protein n=1 Tax=Pseudomonas chlororaphis TaxID=587753 RepID=UPI001B325915